MLITHFADHFATSKTERNYEPAELAQLIARTSAQEKARLPWLKGARFGDVRSERGSLRHDLNVVQVTAVEGDYDGEAMQFDAAWERLALMGVEAVLYTSPSHTPEKPRWRVVCPLSRPYPPAERAKFVAWVNGLLGGVLADESFSLSQSYYFGHLEGCAEFRVEHLRGTPLDEFEELAQIAIGRKSSGNGSQGGPTGSGGAFNEATLIEQIVSGAAFHRPAIRLVGKWARDGVPMLAAKTRLEGAFDRVPESARDTRWRDRRGPDLARILDAVYGKQTAKDDGAAGAEADWRLLRHLDKHAQPIANLHNACLYLQHDEGLGGRLGFDQMRRCTTWDRRPLNDARLRLLHRTLQIRDLRRLSWEIACEAALLVGEERPHHPLRDWLEGQQWDGQDRLGSWLARYLGSADDTYHARVGTMFLVAMVARIFAPGCQADYMLVLEGPQGELKSQCCRTLGGRYFSDSLPNLGADEVRTAAHLRGKWLIEIAELSAFSRADAALLKSFVTRQVEQFIPKFGRTEAVEPRQCCFIGTTNDDQYLKDETGGRRFWPVKCGVIDLDALAQDRPQLFAEAVAAYRDGVTWWPDRAFEKTYLEPAQALRTWIDAWDAPVREYLAQHTKVTLIGVAREALDIDKPRLGTTEQRRIAALLRANEWELKRAGGGERFWQPKSAW